MLAVLNHLCKLFPADQLDAFRTQTLQAQHRECAHTPVGERGGTARVGLVEARDALHPQLLHEQDGLDHHVVREAALEVDHLLAEWEARAAGGGQGSAGRDLRFVLGIPNLYS